MSIFSDWVIFYVNRKKISCLVLFELFHFWKIFFIFRLGYFPSQRRKKYRLWFFFSFFIFGKSASPQVHTKTRMSIFSDWVILHVNGKKISPLVFFELLIFGKSASPQVHTKTRISIFSDWVIFQVNKIKISPLFFFDLFHFRKIGKSTSPHQNALIHNFRLGYFPSQQNKNIASGFF